MGEEKQETQISNAHLIINIDNTKTTMCQQSIHINYINYLYCRIQTKNTQTNKRY